MRWGGVLIAGVLCALVVPAEAGSRQCLRQLDNLGVDFRSVKKRGLAIGVEIKGGQLGGIEYRGYKRRPLVIDCSLAVSLARSGSFLRSIGVERITYSSAFQRRRIRGTRRLSNHSYGLAIDIHTFVGERIGTLKVRDDYEQGLGDNENCVGQPLTEGGLVLRKIDCGLSSSGWYRILLSPDYDAAHYNHFHVEARPWEERELAGR